MRVTHTTHYLAIYRVSKHEMDATRTLSISLSTRASNCLLGTSRLRRIDARRRILAWCRDNLLDRLHNGSRLLHFNFGLLALPADRRCAVLLSGSRNCMLAIAAVSSSSATTRGPGCHLPVLVHNVPHRVAGVVRRHAPVSLPLAGANSTAVEDFGGYGGGPGDVT